MITSPPKFLSALCALCALSSSGCLGLDAPERIVKGSVSDPQGNPISGALVVIEDQKTLTDEDGFFSLEGLPDDATGPIHIAARGYTAWTLDKMRLENLHARLQRKSDAEIQYTSETYALSLRINLPSSLPILRTLYLSYGDTVTPLDILPQTSSREFRLLLPHNAQTIRILAPPTSFPGDEAFWAPRILLNPNLNNLEVTLTPAETTRVEIDLESPDLPLDPPNTHDGHTLSLLCGPPNARALTARSENLFEDLYIDVFPLPEDAPCGLFLSYTYQDPILQNPTEHLAFLDPLSPSDLLRNRLSFPFPGHFSLGNLSNQDTLIWTANTPEIALFDLFLAHRTENNSLPFWSATTHQTRFPLANLPPEITRELDLLPNYAIDMRVVARFAPNLDLEENWDWTGYYGYSTSSWTPISPETLQNWQNGP